MLRQFSDATKEAGRGARAYAANENEENPNLNPKCVQLCQGGKERERHTHTHTHTHVVKEATD